MIALKISDGTVLPLLLVMTWDDRMPTCWDDMTGRMQALWCSMRILGTVWGYVRERIPCFQPTTECGELKLWLSGNFCPMCWALGAGLYPCVPVFMLLYLGVTALVAEVMLYCEKILLWICICSENKRILATFSQAPLMCQALFWYMLYIQLVY